MDSWERVASTQQGCITTGQLQACGVTGNTITRKVRRGELVRQSYGLYVVAGMEMVTAWDQQAWLAVLSAGPGAALSHRSAARVWDLDGVAIRGPSADLVELTAPRARHHGGPGVHRRPDLPNADVTVFNGMPVTTVLRTLVDLGWVVGPDRLERALESALRRKLVTVAGLQHRVVAERGQARVGPAVLDKVLLRRPPGAPATESDAETLFVQLARRAGLPDPIRQHVVAVGGRVIRLDFAWPAVRFAVEIDGAATHANAEALNHDLRRQNGLALRWHLVRFTWRHVALDAPYVVAALRRHYALLCGGPIPDDRQM
jgi:very-short-patch-repair endonuclease